MTAMTNAELTAAIRRAHTEYMQEVDAAKAAYDDARRDIAAVRKGRNASARARRDAQIQGVRKQLAKERAGAQEAATV